MRSKKSEENVRENLLFGGIDPGKNGAIALIDRDLNILSIDDSPKKYDKLNIIAYAEILENHIEMALENNSSGIFYCIEKATFKGNWSRKTIFSFGTYFGEVLGLLGAKQQEEGRVPIYTMLEVARTWKAAVFGKGKTTKEGSLDRALDIFGKSMVASIRTDRESQDRAEALLLASYGMSVLESSSDLEKFRLDRKRPK